ncbi:MAG: RecX family transcriptional regulator, partial [Gemmatimonadaceae bacterium]|nr:RecX family transcriptional regulator [Gemmatimonadaceae bacterium]
MGRFARGVDSGVRLGPGIPDQHLDGPPVDFPTGPISGLEELPRRPGRYRVLVSGTAVCVLNAEAISDLAIRIGTVWEEPLAGRALDRAAALDCFDAAAGALGRRARSRTELRRYLLQRQHAAEHAEAALDRLEALGALDDASYARAFVAARAGRSQSRMRLAAELSRRGVARPVADAALAAVYAEEEIDDRAS